MVVLLWVTFPFGIDAFYMLFDSFKVLPQILLTFQIVITRLKDNTMIDKTIENRRNIGQSVTDNRKVDIFLPA